MTTPRRRMELAEEREAEEARIQQDLDEETAELRIDVWNLIEALVHNGDQSDRPSDEVVRKTIDSIRNICR